LWASHPLDQLIFTCAGWHVT